MKSLSVALATYNEEKNIRECLNSIKDIASEIVIVDGSSTDNTVRIAKEFNARILVKDNPKIFHINKQKALDLATNTWVLQLDADERVTPDLAEEIKKVINMTDPEIESYQNKITQINLFKKHQKLLEKREGSLGKRDGEYAGFFIPRLNYFLGTYLKHGGVYPDGVIRLVKKSKAHFPCVDVHEQIAIDGKIGWLNFPLIHKDSPTFKRYLERNNRYINLIAAEIKSQNSLVAGLDYLFIKPILWFLLTYIRHKGFLDGWQGFIFSFFSALRFPRAYVKSLNNEK